MVAYEREIDTFLHKSSLLLEVFPTARFTTKYRKTSHDHSFITAKTYHPESGAIVKFKTDKTVDLGRLLVGSAKLTSSFAGADIHEYSKASIIDAHVTDTQGGLMELVNQTSADTATMHAEDPKTTTTNSKKKKKKGKK